MEKLNLQKLESSRLQNAEFGQLLTRLFEDITKSGIDLLEDESLKKALKNLEEHLSVYDKALEQTYYNEESKNLVKLDKVRDDDMKALRASIKPYRNAKTEVQKNAYHNLSMLFASYKDVEEQAYEIQTKRMNTLLSLLKSEKYTNDVSALKILPFVEELEKSSSEFEVVFSERSHKNIGKTSYNIRSLRKEMGDSYRKICNYIFSSAEIKQSDFYIKLLDVINNSRKYFSDTFARRITSRRGNESSSIGKIES